jgi:hypothetical protein
MSQTLSATLTYKQRVQIRAYRDKWQDLALTIKPIDREQAKRSIKAAYSLIATDHCAQNFCWNPDVAPDLFGLTFKLWNALRLDLRHKVQLQLENSLLIHLTHCLTEELRSAISYPITQLFEIWMRTWTGDWWRNRNGFACLASEVWAFEGIFLDFCISVLHCDHDPQKWQILQDLTQCCGWLVPTEDGYRVCDRAYILRTDAENRPHAVGQPALEFDQSFGLYAYHGVPLPEKYGKVHPQNWQPEWILEERNAEIRRILIHEIGHDRMYRELDTDEIDTWKEYTLLRIKNLPVQEEEVLYLKMICPSTGKIHILRVPPNRRTAREAIRWVNHGLDPEEFGVQT